jgi:CheY-like chemotaxis protein
VSDSQPAQAIRNLLAEDNPVNQQVVSIMLEVLGCSVRCVENGLEAVEQVSLSHNNPFNLVLMDIHMPQMNGMDATREIRSWEADHTAGTRTPIVALTASAGDDSQQSCLDAGMDGFIIKPIQQDRLSEVINRYGNHLQE